LKVNVINMLRQAGKAIDPNAIGAYPYMLEQLGEHLAALRDGTTTWPEFAEFYCLNDAPPAVDVGAVAVDMVIAALSGPQVRLLKQLKAQAPDFWAYRIDTRGVGLQTAMALVRRGIIAGDPHRPFEDRLNGYVRLTDFGAAIRNIIVERART